ncbi:MAG: glycosyltransferase [Oceanococcus sp.]
MLANVVWIVCATLFCVVAIQFVIALRFVHLLRTASSTPTLPDMDLPKVAVLLGLRGADPFLNQSLHRLMTQDYPDYKLYICVDSEEDPAYAVVMQAIAETGKDVHVETYVELPDRANCTTSKQMQIAHRLDDSVEILVTVDADAMPHARFLRELVSPLIQDDTVAAVFGNHWFMPQRGQFGSLVRYAWNAAAVVYMWVYNMAWGGCFAIRADVVRRLGLIERWSRVIAFDALAKDDLQRAGLTLRFVPSLLVVNREECTTAFCLNFFQRQLTWTRLYHPDWRFITASNFAICALIATCCAGLFIGLVTSDQELAIAGISGILIFLTSMMALLLMLESNVRRGISKRGEHVQWLSPRVLTGLFFASLVAQFLQLIAMIAAMTRRTVSWRGDVIEIRGPFSVRTIFKAPADTLKSKDDCSL